MVMSTSLEKAEECHQFLLCPHQTSRDSHLNRPDIVWISIASSSQDSEFAPMLSHQYPDIFQFVTRIETLGSKMTHLDHPGQEAHCEAPRSL